VTNRLACPLATALASAAIFFASQGCGPSAESIEAARALRAIDALRDAPSEPIADRKKLLESLERLSLTIPRGVAARDACVLAYRALIEGSELRAKVQASLDAPSKIDPSVLRDLVAAEDKIKESQKAMPDCDRTVSELRLSAR
jgi:hypothetical protein